MFLTDRLRIGRPYGPLEVCAFATKFRFIGLPADRQVWVKFLCLDGTSNGWPLLTTSGFSMVLLVVIR